MRVYLSCNNSRSTVSVPACLPSTMLLLLMAVLASASASASFPDYAETFTVHTREYNPSSNEVFVHQTIAMDAQHERSMMLASASFESLIRAWCWPVPSLDPLTWLQWRT